MSQQLQEHDGLRKPACALPPPFACTVHQPGPGAAWLRVTGELDLAACPHLERCLRAGLARARTLVLDLRRVAFMDAAGLRVILAASRSARRNGRHLMIVPGPALVDRLFALTATSGEVQFVDVGPARAAEVARPGSRSLLVA